MFHKKNDNKKVEFKSINSLNTIVATLIHNFLNNYNGLFFDVYEDIDKKQFRDTLIKFTTHHTRDSVNIMMGVEELNTDQLKEMYKKFKNDL
jgi:hypothetical protein